MKDALALALVHFLWQGALLGALGWGFMRLGRSVSVRYAIGVVILGVMLMAPIVTFAVLVPRTAGTTSVAAHPAPLVRDVIGAGVAAAPADGAAPPSLPALPTSWILAVWFVGVSVLSVRVAGGWILAHRLAATLVTPVGRELEGVVANLVQRLALRRAVRVLISSRAATPIMLGWWRPVVLIPASVISGMPVSQIEALLAHEFAHIRRHDYLVNLMQVMVETLCFYHPAVWWMSREVRRERELCCDDIAVAICDRVTYVTALAYVAETSAPRLLLAATGGSMRNRVLRLVAPERQPQSTKGVWMALLPLIFVVTLAGSHLLGTADPTVVPVIEANEPVSAPSAAAPAVTSAALAITSVIPQTAALRDQVTQERGTTANKEALDDLRSLLAADRRTHAILTTQLRTFRVEHEALRANTARVQDLAARGLATADAVLRAERDETAQAGTVRMLEEQLEAVQAKIATHQGKIDSLVGSGPASDPKAPPQVKPGETITIRVEGRPELSGEYVVQPDGTIKLKGVQAEVIQVQVTGAVRSPGVIRLQGGDRRLSRAIAEVGGFASNAGNEVEVIRRGPGRGLIGLKVTRAQLDSNDTTSLQDGDRVNVKVRQVFFVNGEVNSQGEKIWSRGMTVAKALELAGGPTLSFSLARARIERPVKGKDGTVLKYLKIANLTMETLILPDDVLVAGRTPE